MLAYDASWLVPLQPPQEEPRAGAGAVLAAPPQRAQIRDDELARENSRRRGRSREASSRRVDSTFLAPAEKARGLSPEA